MERHACTLTAFNSEYQPIRGADLARAYLDEAGEVPESIFESYYQANYCGLTPIQPAIAELMRQLGIVA